MRSSQNFTEHTESLHAVFRSAPRYIQLETEFTQLKLNSTVLFADIVLSPDGDQDAVYAVLLQAAYDIGQALRSAFGFKVVWFNYSAVPGTLRDIICPILECVSEKKIGTDFGVAFKARSSEGMASPFGVIGVSEPYTQSCLTAILPNQKNGVRYTTLSLAEQAQSLRESDRDETQSVFEARQSWERPDRSGLAKTLSAGDTEALNEVLRQANMP